MVRYIGEALVEDMTKHKAELGIEDGKSNMGKLMGAVMPKVKGRADGGDVRKVVQSVL